MPPAVAVRSRDALVLFPWTFSGAFVAHLAYVEILNDHFDRISRGYQILEFGAVPFRDFFDPGWLLTIYSSAAAQAVFGHRLLGEVILSGVFIAAGIALAAVLVYAACGSRRAAVAAALLLLVAQPRAYDYDKVFFYAFTLFMCWAYAEAPTRRRAALLGAAVAAAGLYRYDNGIYGIAAAVATLLTLHAHQLRIAANRLLAFLGAGAAVCLPAVVLVATHGGIADAVRQVITYATIEGRRTALDVWQVPAVDLDAPLLVIDDERIGGAEILPGWLTRRNAEVFLYYLLRLVPVLALVGLVVLLTRRPVDRRTLARGLSATVLCLLAAAFVMRDPVRARHAALLVPAVVVTAWLLRNAAGTLHGWRRGIRTSAILILGGATFLSAAMLSSWAERAAPLLDSDGMGPVRVFRDRAQRWSSMVSSAPNDDWIYGYLRRCTAPTDRVVVVDFQPQVPWYVERGFGGGMLVFFGTHWTAEPDQQRIVRDLARESVPLIVSREPDTLRRWRLVQDYVERDYSLAGSSAFGENEDERFSVYVRRNAGPPVSRDDRWGLPCFTR